MKNTYREQRGISPESKEWKPHYLLAILGIIIVLFFASGIGTSLASGESKRLDGNIFLVYVGEDIEISMNGLFSGTSGTFECNNTTVSIDGALVAHLTPSIEDTIYLRFNRTNPPWPDEFALVEIRAYNNTPPTVNLTENVYNITENIQWTLDLWTIFSDRESPADLTFQSNNPGTIYIDIDGIARWTPQGDINSIAGLNFTCTDENGNTTTSPDILLNVIQTNDAPTYTGGLNGRKVTENLPMTIDLSYYFIDEENDELAYTLTSGYGATISGNIITIQRNTYTSYFYLGIQAYEIASHSSEVTASIRFSMVSVDDLPHQISTIPSMSKMEGKAITIVLMDYFADEENDAIEFHTNVEGMYINNRTWVATYSPDRPAYNIYFDVYDTTNKVWLKSNYFSIFYSEFNDPPAYTGNTTTYNVGQVAIWTLNLSTVIHDEEEDMIIYFCNTPEAFIIENMLYIPLSKVITDGVIIGAYEVFNPENMVASPPITIIKKSSGLPKQVAPITENIWAPEDITWELDLNKYFVDEEGDELVFYSNNNNVKIDNNKASWLPDPPKTPAIIYGVRITAVEKNNPSRSVTSNTFNLLLYEINDQPIAMILEKPDKIELVNYDGGMYLAGNGIDEEGKVVNYKWISSLDGSLSFKKEDYITFYSVGFHDISFYVSDGNTWSEPDTMTVYVFKDPEFYSTPAAGIIEVITALGIISAFRKRS